jgi:hypothetical protein
MDATLALPLLIGLIAVALFFDFLNGLHDAANSIATIVSTRVLRPQYAVAWAAFFNFIAFLFFGLHVAETLGTGIIDPAIVTPQVIFAALMGAIIWNIVTWIFGIPSSSSHALVGGLVGAGLAKVGGSSIVWSGLLKTAGCDRHVADDRLHAGAAPRADRVLDLRAADAVCGRPHLRILQFVSASLYSLGHGGNDAQKTMGIIAILLYSAGLSRRQFYVPLWVVCPASRQWRSAHCSAAGASSTRWARRSPSSIRCRAFARKRVGRSRCSPRHGWAFPSRPHTRSPARSSASARRGGLGGALGACRQYRDRLGGHAYRRQR